VCKTVPERAASAVCDAMAFHEVRFPASISPVRLDDDTLAVRLLHANAGDIASIPIVELRL
jgi:hypothetical protein